MLHLKIIFITVSIFFWERVGIQSNFEKPRKGKKKSGEFKRNQEKNTIFRDSLELDYLTT